MAQRRVLLLQLDGKFPNLALMRIAAHHREWGDEITLRHAGNVQALQRRLGEASPDTVYASLIFTRTRPLGEAVTRTYPQAIIGGTGWNEHGSGQVWSNPNSATSSRPNQRSKDRVKER